MRRPQSGMTLVELMIVVIILAILAAVAIPSYRQYVLRSHRVEAKAALLNLAAAQEKFYLQNNTYADDDELETAPPNGLGLSATTENGWYDVEITAADADGFAATATATDVDDQDSDTRCASFSLDQAGIKTATNADCWN